MIKPHRLVISMVLLIVGIPFVLIGAPEDETVEQTPELSVEVTADVYGKYIWRGQDINNDPAVQPGINLVAGALSLSAWGSIDTTDVVDESGEFTEIDWVIDYSGDLGILEGVGYSVGMINYQFPSAADTTEIYCGLTLTGPLSPSVTIYYDVEMASSYTSFGVGHSIDNVVGDGLGFPIGLDVSAGLGWGSASYNQSYWGNTVTTGELNDISLAIGFPIEVMGWNVTPSLNYVGLVGDQVKDSNRFNSKDTYVFVGIGFVKEL